MAALIWVFSSLCSLVSYQTALPCEAFVTMDALIWFLPSVCSLVSGQTTLTCKTLVTMAALIWFIPSVCSLVGYQITLACKAFITMAELIWFYPVCVLWCLTRCLLCAKYLLLSLQWYDLTLFSNLCSSCVGSSSNLMSSIWLGKHILPSLVLSYYCSSTFHSIFCYNIHL